MNLSQNHYTTFTFAVYLQETLGQVPYKYWLFV